MAGDGKTTGGAQAFPRGKERCGAEGCDRPLFAQGRCGFHALLGYYRTVAAPGTGLAATRVPRPPRMRGDAEPEQPAPLDDPPRAAR
jgi:hypothetical protein